MRDILNKLAKAIINKTFAVWAFLIPVKGLESLVPGFLVPGFLGSRDSCSWCPVPGSWFELSLVPGSIALGLLVPRLVVLSSKVPGFLVPELEVPGSRVSSSWALGFWFPGSLYLDPCSWVPCPWFQGSWLQANKSYHILCHLTGFTSRESNNKLRPVVKKANKKKQGELVNLSAG